MLPTTNRGAHLPPVPPAYECQHCGRHDPDGTGCCQYCREPDPWEEWDEEVCDEEDDDA